MAVLTQIIAAMLLVPDLVFLVVLTSNPRIMGKHVSGWRKQIAGWGIVALYATMSAVTISISISGIW